MENQHKKITGYRDLSEAEILAMNQVKEIGNMIGDTVDALEAQGSALDQRWVAIGKTHLQQGIMALVRSVAKPESF
jgi:hypothetical protein